MNVRCLIAPFVIAGGLLAGCGDDRSGAAFAAPVEGSDAFVGVVVNEDDGEVLAYMCDGKSLASWFTGQADEAGNVSLASADGATLTGRLAQDRLSGTVTLPGGSAHPFRAPAVADPAGLYRQRGEVGGQAAVGGWVVLPDGRQKGAVRTSSGFTSPRHPAMTSATVPSS